MVATHHVVVRAHYSVELAHFQDFTFTIVGELTPAEVEAVVDCRLAQIHDEGEIVYSDILAYPHEYEAFAQEQRQNGR